MNSYQLGPSSPPIFIGHIKLQRAHEEDNNTLYHHTIKFQHPVQIEGIHVVPNKFTPPGFNIEGLTVPDIHMRSFMFQVHAKEYNTNQSLKDFIILTVHGGVQWHPVTKPIYVDTLLFEGDFEVVTLIVHGNTKQQSLQQLDTTQSVDKLLTAQPSKDLVIKNNSIQGNTNLISKENNVSLEFKADHIIRSSLLSLTGIPSKDLEAIEYQKLRFISSKFKQSDDDMNKISQAQNLNFIKRISYQYQESLISIHQVANLIECIFSYEDKDSTTLSIDDFIAKQLILNDIASNLELCWQSNKDNQMYLFPVDKDNVNISVGAEAITILSAILTSSMDAMRYDSQSIITATTTIKDGVNVFQNYAIAVLKCVKAVLMNEFTALEFTESGGLSFLCYLLQQQLHAPIELFLPRSELFACFQLALSYYNTAITILTPPPDSAEDLNTDLSCYQTFLYLVKDLKSSNHEANQLVDILNRCALVDSLVSFQMYSYTILNSATDISDALISWHHSKIQTTSLSDEQQQNEYTTTTTGSGVENEVSRLVRACEIVNEMYPILIQKCTSLQLSLQALETILLHNNDDGNMLYDASKHISLVMLLSNSKIMTSLVSLISFTLITQELSIATAVDESLPSSHITPLIDQMKSLTQMCHSLFTQLMSLDYSELLFIRHIDELSICLHGISHQFQYVHDVPLYRRSSSIDIIASTNSLSHQEICISLYHRCWFIHLDNYIFTLFNQFIQAITDYLSIDAINNNGNNNGKDIFVVKLLTEILQYCNNPISLESIIKIFCKYFQDLFLNILELIKNKLTNNNTNNDNNNLDIQNMILKLFEYSMYNKPYQLVKQQSLLYLTSNDIINQLQEYYNFYQELYHQNPNLSIHKLDITKLKLYFDEKSLLSNHLNTLILLPTQIIQYLDNFDVEILTNSTSSILFINYLSKILPRYDNNNQFNLDNIILIWNSLLNFMNRLTYILYAISSQYNFINYQPQLYSTNIKYKNDLVKLKISLSPIIPSKDSQQFINNPMEIGLHRIIYLQCLDILKTLLEHVKVILFKISLLTSSNTNIENGMNIDEELLIDSIMKIYLLSENIVLYSPFSLVIQNKNEYILSNIIQIAINIRFNIISIIQSILRFTKQITCISMIIKYGIKSPAYLEQVLILVTYLIPTKYHQYDIDLLNRYIPSRCPVIFENQDIISNKTINNNELERNILHKMISKSKIIEEYNDNIWKEFLLFNINVVDYHYNITSNQPLEMFQNILKTDISFDQILLNYFNQEIINMNDHNIDILYTSLFERKYNIITLILVSIWSTSKSIQNNCVILLHKALVLDLKLSKAISIAIISSLNLRMIKFFTKPQINTINSTTTTIEYDPLQIEDIERKAICRVLISLQDICDDNPLHALLLVENGLLLSLFLALRSPIVSISMIALQYLSSIYKCLSKIIIIERNSTTTTTTTHNKEDELNKEHFINNILLIIEMISAGLAELLPIVLKSFQRLHNYGLLILEQSSLAISILPKPFIHLFLHSLRRVGEGVSLEFIAIKVWSAFDESYENIVENTNLLKALKKDKSLVTISAAMKDHKKTSSKHSVNSNTNTTNQQSQQGGIQYTEADLYDIINKSYRKFHCATSALQAIVNILLLAYTEGWIGLSAIHKAFRTSQHGDPKKLIVKYQKGYVMWKNMINSLIDDKYLNQNNLEYSLSNLSSTIMKTSSSILFTYSLNELIQIESSASENDQFNARHGVLFQNLKLLIDNMLKFSKFAITKEEKYSLIIKENYYKEIINVTDHIINLINPLDNTILFYKKFKYLSERIGFGSSLNYCDIVNKDLRYIIENPLLTIENKMLLPDKKKVISIYYGTNWLMEEFKIIQKLHNEQDAAIHMLATEQSLKQDVPMIKKSRFSMNTDNLLSNNNNNLIIPIAQSIFPRPPPPPPSLPPRGGIMQNQYPPMMNNPSGRMFPPFPNMMSNLNSNPAVVVSIPPFSTTTTGIATFPPPTSMMTAPPRTFHFPRPPRGSLDPRFPFYKKNKDDYNPNPSSKSDSFNKYGSNNRYGFNEKDTNRNEINGDNNSKTNKFHDNKYQNVNNLYKSSYEKGIIDSNKLGTKKDIIEGDIGRRNSTGYRERGYFKEKEKEFQEKITESADRDLVKEYEEKDRGYKEKEKSIREKQKTSRERDNENIKVDDGVRGYREKERGYRDKDSRYETSRRREDSRDRSEATRSKYDMRDHKDDNNMRENNEKRDDNIVKENKDDNVRERNGKERENGKERNVRERENKRGRDSRDREYRHKSYHS